MLRKSLPVAPSMDPALKSIRFPRPSPPFNTRTILIVCISILLGIAAGFIARLLTALIGLITNLSFYGKLSADFSSPVNNHIGLWVLIVPVIGGIIVGYMARYGSTGIRGHGIPEAMEKIVLNESRIPPRLTFLKPLSAAVSIGTGGPFGAEGPIIATGGALGSLIGQLIHTSAAERKILLAAGAAGGMAATFGAPLASVLLAVELLLFEFKPQSLIPVTFASASATAVRILFVGSTPIFSISGLEQPGNFALFYYMVVGLLIGFAAVFVTRSVYKIEDLFEKIPVHWMWWPAIGAVAVGITGYFVPATMGVGYDNITNILTGSLTGKALLILFIFKFISWSISLGSGTSGGTLAPLFTIGGGLGASIGAIGILLFPGGGIDIRIAALVGMAALFAGSARALLTSIIFAFETTLQPIGLLPLLLGCSAAYLVSGLMMKHTIMTEKISRRGVRIPFEYEADFLDFVSVKECAVTSVITLHSDDTIEKIRNWFAAGSAGSIYNNYPVVDNDLKLIGIVSRRALLNPELSLSVKLKEILKNSFPVIHPDNNLKEAVELMAETGNVLLPVVEKGNPFKILGILTRSDILGARRKNLRRSHHFERTLNIYRFNDKSEPQ